MAARPGSLKSLLSGLTALALSRAELFGIEAQEQQERLLGHLLLGGALLVAALLGLIAMLLFVTVVSPLQWRAVLLGTLALLFLCASSLMFWQLKRRLAAAPAAFALTLAEVKKDVDALSGRASQ